MIHKNPRKSKKYIIGNDCCKSGTKQAFCIGNTSITDSTAIVNSFNNILDQLSKS